MSYPHRAPDVAALAHRLRGLATGKWSGADLRRMAADQGWEWVDDDGGPVLRTGADLGEARLRPVDECLEIHVTTEEYVGLHVPLEEVGGATREHVEAFRRAADILRAEFDQPHILGADDDSVPFHDDHPGWGAPFMRWRMRRNSLELRAGARGPVLSLLPSGPAEGWFWYYRKEGVGDVGGFVGTLMSRRSGDQGGSMSFAGITRYSDWKEYCTLLARSLNTMPAELHALGLSRSFGFHGTIPGRGGPWVFQFELGEHAQLGLDQAVVDLFGPARSAPTPQELGWTEATEEHHRSEDVAFHSPRYPYDEVNGTRLAMLVLETAEALGIPSPGDLSLTDWGDHVKVASVTGGWTAEYFLHDYGLRVVGNP
ncbi:hypothetical protein ACFWTE_16545 [Nocardiopsis sp. NPDC058631]|uniref:hypothetical protein n=1 Tax=Nocardiopsis sp. NPDC058631 TaxID=3346566 RepID=UPI003653B5A8